MFQVGVVELSPYRELFLSLSSLAFSSYPGSVGLPSLLATPARNPQAQPKDALPVTSLKLSKLLQSLKVL